jgi:hypothetical protein
LLISVTISLGHSNFNPRVSVPFLISDISCRSLLTFVLRLYPFSLDYHRRPTPSGVLRQRNQGFFSTPPSISNITITRPTNQTLAEKVTYLFFNMPLSNSLPNTDPPILAWLVSMTTPILALCQHVCRPPCLKLNFITLVCSLKSRVSRRFRWLDYIASNRRTDEL